MSVGHHADPFPCITGPGQDGRAVIARYLTRDSLPEGTFVLLPRISKKFLVMSDRIFIFGSLAVPEAHVIWVRVQQSHAAVCRDPIQLPLPDVDIWLAKYD